MEAQNVVFWPRNKHMHIRIHMCTQRRRGLRPAVVVALPTDSATITAPGKYSSATSEVAVSGGKEIVLLYKAPPPGADAGRV